MLASWLWVSLALKPLKLMMFCAMVSHFLFIDSQGLAEKSFGSTLNIVPEILKASSVHVTS